MYEFDMFPLCFYGARGGFVFKRGSDEVVQPLTLDPPFATESNFVTTPLNVDGIAVRHKALLLPDVNPFVVDKGNMTEAVLVRRARLAQPLICNVHRTSSNPAFS